MRNFLFKILFKLKLVIDVLINKFNVESSLCFHNSEYEDKEELHNDDIIIGIYDALKRNECEEYNWNNTILDLEDEDEKYVEDIINRIIDLENYIEINDTYIEIEKSNEDYGRVDIKALCNDSTITDIEKIYLIKLIGNININNNCVKISMNELEVLLNNKNRNQINKKLKDLEVARAIKIVTNNKGNRYYILKHIKGVTSEYQENNHNIRNDTSIISDTLKYKQIEKKNCNDEITDLVIKNINHFKKGVELNKKYLRKLILEKNKIE